MTLHISTPLLESLPLSRAAGRSVWIKLDALQPSGSFKNRGIGFACSHHASRGIKRFISSSGGNAGISVAYCGRKLGIPVVVVVPETTSQRAKDLLADFGAQVLVHGPSWQEANAHALELVTPNDAFIHPFDDPLLWTGHATIIDEIARNGVHPDAVITAVGGGGLYCGVVEGLRRNGLDNTTVIAAETEGMASFHRAFVSGEHVALTSVSGVATSLGAKKIAAEAFRLQRQHPTRSVVVSDSAAIRACRQFLDDHRLLVEPACGAALAPAYDNHPELGNCNCLVIVVCGGVTVTAEMLRNFPA